MSTATRPSRSSRGARAARRLGRSPRRVSIRGRRRALALAVVLGLALSVLYLLVVRDLALFRVESVSLRGTSSDYGPRLRADLRAAARTMTTLHVREGVLRRVASRYPAVVALEADAELPHRLAVRIAERPPVGLVSGPAGREVAVARDGTLLRGADRPLPRLPGRASTARRSRDPATLAAARLAAAAPRPLAAWLEEVRRGPNGWVVKLRRGPELRFGALSRVAEKWAAAATVLGARSARSAGYLDLRLPDRPAAGGFRAKGRARPVTSDGVAEAGSPGNSQGKLQTSPQP